MKATRHRLAVFVLLVPVAVLCGGGLAGAGEPPLADAGLDQQVERNATVLLDAAGSRDPDGSIQSYRWTVRTPDGRTIAPATPDAPRTTLRVRQPGRYEVTVTVTDDEGQSASDTLYVDVSERTTDSASSPDSAGPAPDTTPGLPESTTPASDGVTDPASPDAPVPTTSTTGSDAGTTADGCPAGTTRVTAAGCLETGDPPATVDVEGERYVRQGSVHTYTATVNDRPGGNEQLSWSGGLGTGDTLTRAFTEPPGSTVTITATVEDGEGQVTSDSILVRVVTDNAPPEVRIEGPIAACVGDPIELEGYAVASEDHDRVVDATWHGDPTFVPQHPGQYQVGFSARDRQGQTARTTHTVTVREERVCNPSHGYDRENAEEVDKLLIRADDDNWVEGSNVSPLMKARGNVPESGPVEKLADIGASVGKAGEGASEFATGNRETVVLTMSAENASKLEENIRTTPVDEVVAGANGPRINEHERLKNASVSDQVETESGQVKVVIRIGQDNRGRPDTLGNTESDQSPGRVTTGTKDGGAKEQTGSNLASKDEQKTALNQSGPIETTTRVVDTVSDSIEQVARSGTNMLSDDSSGSTSSGDDRSNSEGDVQTGDSSADSPVSNSGERSPSPSTPETDSVSQSSSSDSTDVPSTSALDGIVDTASEDTDGISNSTGGANSASNSSDDGGSSIDGSGAWGGII